MQQINLALRRQKSVLLALIFKDYKVRTGSGNVGLFWILLEPMVQITVLSMFWFFLGIHEIERIPVFEFIGLGVFGYLIIQRSLTIVPQAIVASRALLDYPQVKPFDCLFARFLLDMGLLTISLLAVFAGLAWFGGYIVAASDPLSFVAVVLLLMTLGFGLALVIGVYGTLYESLGRAVSIASRPLLFVSAVFYTIQQLPSEARDILQWNPLLHGIELARVYLLGMQRPAEISLTYLGMWAVSVLAFGLVAYVANRYRLIQR